MFKVFSKPPFVGVIAFIAVLFFQPMGHIIMILIEQAYQVYNMMGGWYSDVHITNPVIPENYEDFAIIRPYIYWAAFGIGALGLAIIYWGVRKNTELAGSWAGFIGGTLVWTGWVEFSLHYYARFYGVKALCEPSVISYACANNPSTKPEYFLMQSSVGLLLAIGLFFLFNKETRCNLFLWLHRFFKMKVGQPTKGMRHNTANIVAAETIYILWFFYVYLMFIYDSSVFGENHWFTYASFATFLMWSLYLIQRLVRHKNVSRALRYAIPTVIIFWNSIEIMGRWNWFKEFWIHPLDYKTEAIALTVGLLLFTLFSIKSALDKQKQL